MDHSQKSYLCPPEEIKFPLDSFKDKGYLTHNFHPYPAKFVPHIPRNVILGLSSEGETVLDPFCGSGTSLVEANILNRPAIGLDLNPLACLISRVKTTSLNFFQLNRIRETVHQLARIQSNVAREDYSDCEAFSIPEFLNREHWFQPHVLKELSLIKATIEQESDKQISDFLKVAFSAIIVKVSNQDSDTRWVAVEKALPFGKTIRSFREKVINMADRMESYRNLSVSATHVFQQSITDQFLLDNESVDLVVTSPPYPNSFDYYLYHKLRFFWLGFDHHSVQAQELGSRHRHSDKNEGIETYSNGILPAFKEIHRVLKTGRFLCVVIGDAILKGTLVDMNEVYVTYGESTGLRPIHHHSFDQRKYSTSFTRNLKSVFKKSHIMFFRKD